MERIQAFRTSDSTVFTSEAEAAEHEYSLRWLDHIAEFSASSFAPYRVGSQVHIMRKTIVAWEKWKSETERLVRE